MVYNIKAVAEMAERSNAHDSKSCDAGMYPRVQIPLSAPEIRHPFWDALFLFTLIFERDLRVGDVCGSKQFALRGKKTVIRQANWTIDNCPSGRAAKSANPSLCARKRGVQMDTSFSVVLGFLRGI